MAEGGPGVVVPLPGLPEAAVHDAEFYKSSRR